MLQILPGLVLLIAAMLLAEPMLAQQTAGAEAEPSGSEQREGADSELSPAARLGKFYWGEATQAMRPELSRVDNYTCIHHINRYEWEPRSRDFRRIDTVMLQVSSVDGAEYFGLPGSDFMVRDPRDVVAGGLLASGFFQGFARSLFVYQAVEKLVFRGSATAGEQDYFRFQFETDRGVNPLRVRISTSSAAVAAKGEFWLDRKDLRLRRLVVENLEPLNTLRLKRVVNVMDWAPVVTSHGDVLLPQRADMWMVLGNGRIERNEVTLAQCREYRAESTIRFDNEDEEQTPSASSEGGDANAAASDGGSQKVPFVSLDALAAGAPEARSVVKIAASAFLPGAVDVKVVLQEAINLQQGRVGDVFRASLESNVVHRGRVLAPAGTEVFGRIRRLERLSAPVPHVVVWLEFPVVRHGGREYTFLAELTRRSNLQGLVERVPGMESAKPVTDPQGEAFLSLQGPEPGYAAVPGVASYVFLGSSPETIPAGHRMEWKTIQVDSK